MTYNKLSTSLLFTGMLIFSGCGSDDIVNSSATSSTTAPATTSSTSTPASSTPAPTVASTTITTTSGRSIKVNRTQNGLVFEGYEGKIVLLDIYGDTCPYCRQSIPTINNIRAKYPNDVYVIAIESYGKLNSAALAAFAASNGMQYDTVATANAGSMFTFITELSGYTTTQGVPAYFIFARDGVLANYIPPTIGNSTQIDSFIQALR